MKQSSCVNLTTSLTPLTTTAIVASVEHRSILFIGSTFRKEFHINIVYLQTANQSSFVNVHCYNAYQLYEYVIDTLLLSDRNSCLYSPRTILQ